MLVGIDSLEVARIASIIKTKENALKVFTEYEWEYGNKTVNKLARFAGMFCAKEAFLKCLKLGIGNSVLLSDIEVRHSSSGAPELNLSENAKSVMQKLGVGSAEISITHTKQTSTAICICF